VSACTICGERIARFFLIGRVDGPQGTNIVAISTAKLKEATT
jgi:hypothetical protein